MVLAANLVRFDVVQMRGVNRLVPVVFLAFAWWCSKLPWWRNGCCIWIERDCDWKMVVAHEIGCATHERGDGKW